jgi:hypothetical protein
MPTYEIEQYELHCSKFRIEAESPADAIARLFEGEGDPVDHSLEYIEIVEDYGMPVEEFPELAQELEHRGVLTDEDFIPSIRSIIEVQSANKRESAPAITAS